MIAALLAFYDEPTDFLARMAESLPMASVGRLEALDGAYSLFPGGSTCSPAGQSETLYEACDRVGVECRVAQADRLWETEMDKRSALLGMAADLSRDDWLLVIDADCEVAAAPPDLLALLGRVEEDCATAKLLTAPGSYFPNLAPEGPLRCLFRAGLGLRVVGNHWTYMTADGRRLWGRAGDKLERPHDLTGEVRILHHTNRRPLERASRQISYYQARDKAGIERGGCELCRVRRARHVVLTDLTAADNDQASAVWAEVCDTCEPEASARFERTARTLGIGPEQLAEFQHTRRR